MPWRLFKVMLGIAALGVVLLNGDAAAKIVGQFGSTWSGLLRVLMTSDVRRGQATTGR